MIEDVKMPDAVYYHNKVVEKVFIALRTNQFDVQDEHITIKYYNNISVNTLGNFAQYYDNLKPAKLRLNGFANWTAGLIHYEVALVDNFPFKAPIFNDVSTPHITIRKSAGPISNATFIPEIYGKPFEHMGLWVGKKVKGRIDWLPAATLDKDEVIQRWCE